MPRFRIAPTPSGYPHVGNAFNFILTSRLAQRLDAELILRIDDLDVERTRQEYSDDIHASLEWLGLTGRTQVPGLKAHVRQSERVDLYDDVIQQMVDADLLFACTCTRSEIQARNSHLDYDGFCVASGKPLDMPDVAWRIRYADALQPYSVVRQKNGRPAYMMATMVDDVEMGITHIVRGEDLRATSQTQRSIATLMGGISVGGVPMRRYLDIATHHHPLITDERGEKLSKSAGASSLRDLRANGRSAQWILDMVERYLVEREDLFGETLP